MAVQDHGLEVLKKSGEQVTPGNASNLYLKVGLHGAFSVPALADAITVTYPTSTTEVYVYRQGGVSGTALMTLTLTYTNSSKTFLSSAVKS